MGGGGGGGEVEQHTYCAACSFKGRGDQKSVAETASTNPTAENN